MTIQFHNRVAIVTGAGQGLGRCHALQLAARGAYVVVNDLAGARGNQENDVNPADAVVAEIIQAGGQAISNAANVCNPDEVQAMVDRAMAQWGRVDILINNAGILRDKTFGKMLAEDFNSVVDVHLLGSANCSRAVWNIMRDQHYGRILMTTSTSGVFGNFGQSNYGAAKTGLLGLMNVLHLEGSRYGIKVNGLAPTAATRMTSALFDSDDLAQLKPEFVTPAALFLVSEDCPSRTVLLAGAGTYAKLAIMESHGIYLDEAERNPDTIAARFDEIIQLDGALETSEGLAHVDRILKRNRQSHA